MAIDSSAGDVALGQLGSLPFADLIGGPLNAAIQAQAAAAISTYEFIKAVGVTENSTTKTLEAVTVAFAFQSSSGETRNLIVPLLSIVPIPLIVIDDLTVSFKANISAEASTSKTTTDAAEFGAKGSASLGNYFTNANFSASYSSKKDSTATQQSRYSVEYTMDINLHASQAGMPAGLATVLQLLAGSTFTTDPNGTIALTASKTTLTSTDTTVWLNVRLVDGSNRGVQGIVPKASSDNTALVPNNASTAATDANGYTAINMTFTPGTAGPATVTVTAQLTATDYHPILTQSQKYRLDASGT